MNRAVFLDRDNTLIHNDADLGDPNLVRLIQGVASAIASLRGLGYRIVVISNQGGVARGRFSEEDVDKVNARVAELIKASTGATIDRFYYCPFHPTGSVEKYTREHPWRKPQAGMLKQAAEDLKLDLAASWTVGDQPRDVEAGRAAGTRTILLRDQAAATEADADAAGLAGNAADFVVRNLVEAVRIIAKAPRPERDIPTPQPKPEPAAPTPPLFKSEPQSPSLNKPTAEPAAPQARPFAPAATSTAAPRKPVVIDIQPTAADLEAATEPAAVPTLFAAKAAAGSSPLEIAPLVPPRPVVTAVPPAAIPAGPLSPLRLSESDDEEPDASVTPPKPAAAPDFDPGDVSTHELLRQLVRELKNQRLDHNDFSYAKMLAGVVQMAALGCGMFALIGLNQPQSASVLWLLGAIFLQLVVNALLSSRW
jgi:D-glycero-D-manno-heptose 1,7-bisphosphate phosphatase